MSYNIIKELLLERDLTINTEKTELVSENKDDFLINSADSKVIGASDDCKYLGQYIDSQGNSRYSLDDRFFGKITNILKTNKSLTRKAKVRIFQTYMRTKFNHLIPILVTSDATHETWTFIRKVIFHQILEGATLPRESRALMKIGFYNILIKPMLKTVNSLMSIERHEEADFVRMSVNKLLDHWTTAEENISQEILSMITTIKQTNNYNIIQIDKIVQTEAAKRLLQYSDLIQIAEKLENVSLPNIILKLSNAPIHEIIERIKNHWKGKDNLEKDTEKQRIRLLVDQETIPVEYIKIWPESSEELEEHTLSLENKIERYYHREAEVRQRLITVQSTCIDRNENIVNALIQTNKDPNTNGTEFKLVDFMNIHNQFREMIINHQNRHEEIEMILELSRENTQKLYKPKLGRPPKLRTKQIKKTDNKQINDFFNKKK